MNNTAYNVDFTRLLPEPLKNDDNMLALGQAIAGELQQNIRLARLTIIYPRIDELDEITLDILARDLHVDWYNDAYPIAAKRAVIKSSVQINKRLGTKYAVVKALGDLFPNTEVQEWFEYSGTHHHFRIILDLTNAKAPADLSQIISAAKFYKRLSAHLEEVIYQMSAVIEIHTETVFYRYRTGQTDTYRTGTHPHCNTVGGISDAFTEVHTGGDNYSFESAQSGTKPVRNIELIDVAEGVTVQAEIRDFPFSSEQSGTTPARSTEYTNYNNNVSAEITAETFLYTVNMTGQDNAGEKPQTNTGGQIDEGGVVPTVTGEGFSFHVKRCGTSVAKNNKKG